MTSIFLVKNEIYEIGSKMLHELSLYVLVCALIKSYIKNKMQYKLVYQMTSTYSNLSQYSV